VTLIDTWSQEINQVYEKSRDHIPGVQEHPGHRRFFCACTVDLIEKSY